jgi:cell wall-associated NlpC family hydrolase
VLHHTRGVRRSAVLAFSALGIIAGGMAGSAAFASPASAASAATVSTPIKITTSTYIRATSTSVTRYDQVGLWGRVRYDSGRHAVVGQAVQLQLHDSAGWRTIGTANSDGNGYVHYAVMPWRTSTYRMYYAGHRGYYTSVSSNLLITLRPATRASRVVAVAASEVGDWYVFGAAGPTYFDCSGLTLYAFRAVGVFLPHNANAQKSYGRAVSWAAARPGDTRVSTRATATCTTPRTRVRPWAGTESGPRMWCSGGWCRNTPCSSMTGAWPMRAAPPFRGQGGASRGPPLASFTQAGIPYWHSATGRAPSIFLHERAETGPCAPDGA